MYKIKDIAKICNVSPATVSNVINGKTNKVSPQTAEMILSKIEEIGYRPNSFAKGLRSNKTKILGVIAEDLSLFNVPAIINGITACCDEYGYKFFLENLRLYDRWDGSWFDDQEKYDSVFGPALKEMNALNTDGIIYVAGHTRKITSFKQDGKRPVVMTYSIAADNNIPSFIIDDEKAAYEVTSNLIKKGHKKIGVISGERSNYHSMNRTDGYQRALYDNHILYDPTLVCFGPWDRSTGYKYASDLMEKGVTAIFCYADYIAGGVYDYLEEKGMRAGEEISVFGFDDHKFASYMSPKLSTVKLPLNEIGYKSAKRLIDMIEFSDEDETLGPTIEHVSCEIIERNSCSEIK